MRTALSPALCKDNDRNGAHIARASGHGMAARPTWDVWGASCGRGAAQQLRILRTNHRRFWKPTVPRSRQRTAPCSLSVLLDAAVGSERKRQARADQDAHAGFTFDPSQSGKHTRAMTERFGECGPTPCLPVLHKRQYTPLASAFAHRLNLHAMFAVQHVALPSFQEAFGRACSDSEAALLVVLMRSHSRDRRM